MLMKWLSLILTVANNMALVSVSFLIYIRVFSNLKEICWFF